MKKKYGIIIGIIAIIAIIIWFATGKSSRNDSDKPVVKIGVILPLTGTYAELGKNAQRAVELAVKKASPKNVSVNLIFEDYAFEAPRAATVAHKLIDIDKVNALISWSSPAGGAVAPIANEKGILHIGITNLKDIAKGDYNFINFTSTDSYIDKLMEVIKKKNIKSVYMFVVYQPSLQHTSDILEQKLKASGIQVLRENFTQDYKDFDLMLSKANEKYFDMWFIAALPPSLDILLKTYHSKQIKTQLMSMDGFNFVKEKELIEGAKFASPAEADKTIMDEIQNKTGSSNFFGIGFIYDSALILTTIYENLTEKLGRTPTSKEVSDEIKKVKNFDGIVGKINISQDGVIDSDAVLKKIENGKPVLIKE